MIGCHSDHIIENHADILFSISQWQRSQQNYGCAQLQAPSSQINLLMAWVAVPDNINLD